MVRDASGNPDGAIRLLDIGSGTGEFLSACKENGLKTVGIEPSDKAREFSKREYGLNVLPESGLASMDPSSFDVITMWHVLEHVHQLKARVEEINRLLVNGGVVLIAVPNRESYDALKYGPEWAAYDVPRHLYHFTRKDVQALFESSSFKLEQTLPMKFDAFYVSMLSDKNCGRSNLIRSTWNGLMSNLKASTAKGTWSSQIYIFRKAGND